MVEDRRRFGGRRNILQHKWPSSPTLQNAQDIQQPESTDCFLGCLTSQSGDRRMVNSLTHRRPDSASQQQGNPWICPEPSSTSLGNQTLKGKQKASSGRPPGNPYEYKDSSNADRGSQHMNPGKGYADQQNVDTSTTCNSHPMLKMDVNGDANFSKDGGYSRLLNGFWPKVEGRPWVFDRVQHPGARRS